MNWRGTLGLALAFSIGATAADRVRTQSGTIEGIPGSGSTIRTFRGIPFAAPPVGDLRWKPPQPAPSWSGVRKATEFGARCMQGSIFKDMVFRDPGPSEDCLYLNVWTPASSSQARLPVMVWIYGGGFGAGSASEPRQDGESLAKKGVVVVSFNYRLGIFGFFSLPELTKESAHKASGNYGLLDQVAALEWVHKNIAAFGGDPDKVTIFGESAGSISVSLLMASPLSKGLFQRAIGESGGAFLARPIQPISSQTEESPASLEKLFGAADLAALREKSAEGILQVALQNKNIACCWPAIDGYFLPESPSAIYGAGKQAHVPLLAGWNADEQGYEGLLRKTPPSTESYSAKIHELYGDHAGEILTAYPADSTQQVKESARDLASDRFIAYSTWKWLDMQLETGKSPVYRYHFEQAPPMPKGAPSRGAYHSADIEYVFEALDSKHLPWTSGDKKLSEMISAYWTNFAKTGNPNGPGLPEWPEYKKSDGYELLHLNSESAHAAPTTLRSRYELLDRINKEK
jgi:para-nitrobenzyl esterase